MSFNWMKADGVIMLNDDVIGEFAFVDGDLLAVTFEKESHDLKDTLELATEQGLNFTLRLKPEFEDS